MVAPVVAGVGTGGEAAMDVESGGRSSTESAVWLAPGDGDHAAFERAVRARTDPADWPGRPQRQPA